MIQGKRLRFVVARLEILQLCNRPVFSDLPVVSQNCTTWQVNLCTCISAEPSAVFNLMFDTETIYIMDSEPLIFRMSTNIFHT